MEKGKLTYKDKFDTQRPRIKKTLSFIPNLSPKSNKLPSICTPRKKLESFKSRKQSVPELGLRLSLLGPLPSLKIKTQNRDGFGESPILPIIPDEETQVHVVTQFMRQFRIPKRVESELRIIY